MMEKISHKFIHKMPNIEVDPYSKETIAFLIKDKNHEIGGYLIVKEHESYFKKMRELVKEKHKCIEIWRNM